MRPAVQWTCRAGLWRRGLSEVLHQRVVVENITGAGGTTGILRVARAAPDGYKFVVGGVGNMAFAQTLYKKPPYNSVTDFAPVVAITEQPLVLITRKDLAANNLQEFVAPAGCEPGLRHRRTRRESPQVR